ncbi:MAG: phosphoribosylglycinamide synthetase C domain-containing protein, partial [Dehalococcoidia bacterium]
GHRVVTDGGRVLTVSALGANQEEARQRAYRALSHIHFEGMIYRRDIALLRQGGK